MPKTKVQNSINLPECSGETAVTILGEFILFVEADNDTDCTNPLEDCDGMGEIQSTHRDRGERIDEDQMYCNLMEDTDTVPLRFSDYGPSISWKVDHNSIDELTANRVAARLVADSDFYDALRDLSVNGIWTPDKCVRDSYDGQDGLTRWQWMVQQAESACEVYTQWCNGECYGYNISLYKIRRDDDGEPFDQLDDYRRDKEVEEDSCWGFWGWEHFEESMKEAAEELGRRHHA